MRLSRRNLRSILAGLFAVAATACGGGSTATGGDPVAAVTVTGLSQSLLAGATSRATATATDAGGAVLTRTFTWSSSSTAVATVGSDGTVTGVSAGTATISASVEGKTGSAIVTVAARPVATVTVTGPSPTVVVGTNGQATATATDALGAVLSRTFTWTSGNAAIATVAADGTVTGVSAGPVTISASVDGKSGNASITVNNPLPSVTTLSPGSFLAGGPPQTLTVIGTGFVNGSVARWNGTDLATTFLSPTRVTALVPATFFSTAGSAAVTVFNGVPGGGPSSSVTFTLVAPGNNRVPAIVSLAPLSTAVGGPAFTLTVTGTDFIPGSTAKWNGAIRPTTFVSATQLTAQISAADIAVIGNAAVTVFTPAPGGGTSLPQSFVVFASLPVLTYSQLPPALVAQLDASISTSAQNAAVNITAPGLPSGHAGSFALAQPVGSGRGIAAERRGGTSPGAQLRATGDCPLIVPAQPPVNVAGLPTSQVTYTFTLANCTEDAFTSKSGVVTLTDPNPAASTLDYDILAVNFDARIGDSTGTVEDVINAVDSVRNRSSGVVDEWVTETLTLDETGNQFGHLVETLALHTVYSYPAGSGQLVYNVPMFAGTIVLDQTVTYVVAPGNNFGVSGTFTIVTSTLTPLQFDPHCLADIQYVGGVLQSVVAGHITTTTYHACNTPPTVQ